MRNVKVYDRSGKLFEVSTADARDLCQSGNFFTSKPENDATAKSTVEEVKDEVKDEVTSEEASEEVTVEKESEEATAKETPKNSRRRAKVSE